MVGTTVLTTPPPTCPGSTPKMVRNRASVSVPRKSTMYPFGTGPENGLIPSKTFAYSLTSFSLISFMFRSRDAATVDRFIANATGIDKRLSSMAGSARLFRENLGPGARRGVSAVGLRPEGPERNLEHRNAKRHSTRLIAERRRRTSQGGLHAISERGVMLCGCTRACPDCCGAERRAAGSGRKGLVPLAGLPQRARDGAPSHVPAGARVELPHPLS